MHKRLILCGPTCAGKNFIRDKFIKKGYSADCSYTSREPRRGSMYVNSETDGIDYKFIGTPRFMEMIAERKFYEWVEYNGNFYGTGLDEWNQCDIFIMETDGIKHIEPKDRKDCLIIYINTPQSIRVKRMEERGWNEKTIHDRLFTDLKKFKDFKDFDFEIASYEKDTVC